MSTANLSRRTLRLRALAVAFGGAAVVAMLVLGVVTVQQIQTSNDRLLAGAHTARVQRADGIRLTQQVKALAIHLTECTTRPDLRKPPADIKDLPKDDCYVQQQSGAADFASPRSAFGQLVIMAAACGAANPGNIPATQACVVKAVTR